MSFSYKDVSNPRLNTIFLGVAFFWSVVIVALAAWNYWQSYTSTVEVARSSANQSYNKDLVYRRWATVHGGIYAPITPETPPNPYLSDIPERDISTPSDKKLTLINPAYMTRQVHEQGKKDLGLIGHITSLKPIRPENAPDEWEKSALQAFEHGQKEVSALSPIGNETYLRFMRPLITELGCLKCHSTQGYNVGDIRGGISVSLPWTPFRAALRSILLVIIVGYGGIWTIGILGMYLGRKRLNNHLSKRKRAEEALLESEERFRGMVERINDVIFEVDHQGVLLYFSPVGKDVLGYDAEDVVGMNFIKLVHPDDRSIITERFVELSTGVEAPLVYRVKSKTGEFKWVRTKTKPRIENGIFFGGSGVLIDITDRKLAEEQAALLSLQQFSQATYDALPFNICVLDKKGTILSVNRTWREFAEDNPPCPVNHWLGANYFNVCENAGGNDAETAKSFTEGIRIVMYGDREEFSMEYPCHSSTEKRWFIGRVTRLLGAEPLHIVIAHENITERKLAEVEHDQQLVFTKALNEIAETIIFKDNSEDILESSNRIIGETLHLDRALIYDVSFEKNHITGLCEWLKVKHPDIAPTKDVYPLDMFLNPFTEITCEYRILPQK